MTKLIRGLKSVCGLASPIVLIGEMGTGKSALAHAVHRASQRDNKCFEELDLLAIPQSRMQQVLFGKTEGLIAKAHGGTLVIDNINAADFEVQRKLKYFLETGSFLTDCGQYEIQADTRIIFLSRLSLESDLANNLIDESLYYQISRYTLLVPSLVDRKQDLAGLCSSIIADHCAKLNKANLKISQNCMDVISHYRWDGNVKQLQNALCRAVSLSDTNTIESIDIQLPNILVTEPLDVQRMAGTLDQEVKNFERNLLAKLYPDYPSTRLLGKKLGLSHTAVANKLREYGINKQNLQF